MKFIRGFRKFKLIKESLGETKSFFEKNKEVILSYYKFIFDNCGNATAIEEFKSKWSQLLDFIKKDYPSSFNEFKNWISNETKTRLKLSLKLSLANWQKQNKESLDIINEFETMLGFSLSGEKIQNLSTDDTDDENCFDNETLGVVQLLPHNFKRSGKDVICKEKPEFDPNKKSILYSLSEGGDKTLILLPGAGKDGGQGKDDFQLLANTLGEDFSVYSADFVNDFDVREYAKNIANEIEVNDDIKQFAVGGFSIGGAIAWHLAKDLEGSKKFNNQLFFIDSGIANSTEEFAEGIVKGNTPRIAMATPVGLVKKARSGGDFTKSEQKAVKHIYTESELADFKSNNKGNYIEYIGKDFPPANTKLDADAKTINEKNPDEVYIIEDKYDTTKFDVRYSVKPKEIKGISFKEGDVINNRHFVMEDTLKKKGLGRETESGEMLPPLNGVEVISLIAGNKEGKPKPKEEIESSRKDAEGSTTGVSKSIVISGAEHHEITKYPDLAKNISGNFKKE